MPEIENKYKELNYWKIASLSLVFGIIGLLIIGIFIKPFASSKQNTQMSVATLQNGDLAKRGGTATIRKAFVPKEDDRKTTNDETNDQPIGSFGTKTLFCTNITSGSSYYLDVEIDERNDLRRVYFSQRRLGRL
jgi:hypothetical protein